MSALASPVGSGLTGGGMAQADSARSADAAAESCLKSMMRPQIIQRQTVRTQ